VRLAGVRGTRTPRAPSSGREVSSAALRTRGDLRGAEPARRRIRAHRRPCRHPPRIAGAHRRCGHLSSE
jgi:hypothetical protein